MKRVIAVATMLAAAAAPVSAQDQTRKPASPEARQALAHFARCITARSHAKAHDTLTMDFRTREYRAALRTLANTNRDCHRNRRTMRSGGLPLAAALAEQMLLMDRVPLNVRLTRAAATNAPTFAPSDQVAMCVARSDPHNAAALLSSGIASAAEAQAASALVPAKARCTPPGVTVDVDAYGLRSILATASYRLIATAATGDRG